MAASWSKATLLRRMEQEFDDYAGQPLVMDDGTINPQVKSVTVAEFAQYIARQIVVESMTGRKAPTPPRALDVTQVTDDGKE